MVYRPQLLLSLRRCYLSGRTEIPLNRDVKEKLLPDESDDDEEAEEEVEASVSYSESTT